MIFKQPNNQAHNEWIRIEIREFTDEVGAFGAWRGTLGPDDVPDISNRMKTVEEAFRVNLQWNFRQTQGLSMDCQGGSGQERIIRDRWDSLSRASCGSIRA